MAKSINQKLKMFYELQYLMEKTDEEHSVTTKEMIEYLDGLDIKAERKSIYDDMEQLRDFGYDILRSNDAKRGYYLASRDFELAELKLLVDLVQSAKFITTKKSRELIKKLEKLASKYEATQLQRQVVVADRNKTVNEKIYYNVDLIYRAMAQNVEVRFQYFEWDEKKQMKLRKNGAYYEVSPWVLTWDDENYYLMAYDSEAGIIKHFRVDKMLQVEVGEKPRQGRTVAEEIDIAAISKKTFGMFAGEEKTIQLRVKKEMIGIIIDRFGRDVAVRPLDEQNLLVRVDVAVSPQFYGWLAGLGNKLSIVSPEEVKEDYRNYLKDIIEAM